MNEQPDPGIPTPASAPAVYLDAACRKVEALADELLLRLQHGDPVRPLVESYRLWAEAVRRGLSATIEGEKTP